MSTCNNRNTITQGSSFAAFSSEPASSGASVPAQDAAPVLSDYDCIFFDLDGTLLPIDMPEFLHAYYQLLEARAAQAGFDAARFAEALDAGIRAMMKHAPGLTNADAFWDVFLAQLHPQGATSAQRDNAVRFMDSFYRHDFNQIGKGIVPNPAAAQALETLQAKGYPLFLCTMPLFPRSAVEHRLRWAGVDPALFKRITTYDNSTDVKPSLAYYRENVELAGVVPARVLMVGNDTSDDLSCLELGMDAFLVTDHLIDQRDFDIAQVKHASLAGFADWVTSLPRCTSTRACEWRQRADALRQDTTQEA